VEDTAYGIALLARIAVGGLLLIAALSKLRQREAFAWSLRQYSFFNPQARELVARCLPPAEGTLGILLVSGAAQPWASGLAGGLFVLFLAVSLGTFGWQGRHDCACFGRLTSTTVRSLSVRNLALTVLAVVAASGHWNLEAWAVVALAGVTALSLILLVPSLMSLLPATASTEPEPDQDPKGRRAFLRLAAAFVGAGGLLLLTRGTPVAEAGCSYCGSCASTYSFIGCTGGGCAMYWVRKRTYCDAGCSVCGTSQIVEYCGIPGC
jgi:hypothetical protein